MKIILIKFILALSVFISFLNSVLAKAFSLKLLNSNKRSVHFVLSLLILSFPIFFGFQNCANQKFESQLNSSKSSEISNESFQDTCSPTQSRVCQVGQGVGVQFCEENGTAKACIIESCNAGYIFKNNQCQPQACHANSTTSCSERNGFGIKTCNSDGLGFGSCELNACESGFKLEPNNSCSALACMPKTSISCSIDNGMGLRTCLDDGSAYSTCKAISCVNGYKVSGDTCVTNCKKDEKEICSAGNGTGERSCLSTGAGFGSCHLTKCQDGYNLQNGACIANLCVANKPSSCSMNNGTGTQICNALGTGYGACELNACSTGYALLGTSCVPKVCQANTPSTCDIENGFGEKICNATSTGFGLCQPKICNDGFTPENGSCQKKNSTELIGRTVIVGYGGLKMTTADSAAHWLFNKYDFAGGGDDDSLFRTVTYANNQFVAIGHRVQISSDGVNWTNNINLPYRNWYSGLVYANGRWVAVGGCGAKAYSDDNARTWKAIQSLNGCIAHLRNLTYGNNIFIATSYYADGDHGGLREVSFDGVKWVPANSILDEFKYFIFAYGKFYSNKGSQIYSSTDAKNWIAVSSLPNDNYLTLNFSYNKIIITSASASYVSSDGINWQKGRPSPSAGKIYFNGNSYFSLGWKQIYKSVDLQSWQNIQVDSNSPQEMMTVGP